MKKRFEKFLSLMLVFLLVCGLCGCNGSKTEEKATETKENKEVVDLSWYPRRLRRKPAAILIL